MPELIHVYRGALIENIIRGDIVVINEHAQIVNEIGNGHKVSYMRSSAKPLQASAVVEKGAISAFGIDNQELAIMCASHNGEDYHVKAVETILSKIGMVEDDLTLGADYSYNSKIREKMLKTDLPKRKLINNCSGKHAAMLALCKHLNLPKRNYNLPEHAVQQWILETVASYTGMLKEDIILGIDGCGVPVFAMPLYNMALGYLNLLNPDRLGEKRAMAARQIVAAMAQYPEMVAGNGEFCTELIRVTKGRLIAKKGADGIYCCAQKEGPALALKIEDGNMQVLPQVLLAALSQLGLLNFQEEHKLTEYVQSEIINCQGNVVGEKVTVFNFGN